MEDEKKENVDTQTTTDNAQKEQKTENKNEGTKANEQSKSKNGITKNEDGSITFESQEKFEEFASKMFRKGADKVEQKKTIEGASNSESVQEDTKQEEPKQTATQDYTDKIALAMAKAGVDVQKVERAARLVNMSKVLENGVVDSKKLEDEINAVIAEFPELKNAKEEEKQEKGFKFGATESTSNSNQTQKRPVATKRWNRFNSF